MECEKLNNNFQYLKVDKFPTKIEKHIRNIAKDEGYITYDVEKNKLSPKGGSYMGLLYQINVKGKTEEGNKETNIFIKQIVTSNIPMIYEIPDVYKRENFVYTKLAKELYNLQQEFNVPVDDRFKTAKVFSECDDETIILENLASKGFKTYYRMDIVNLEYAELVIKELARFHGISMALEIKRPDFFEKHIKNMHCLYKFDDNWHGFTHNMWQNVDKTYLKINTEQKAKLLNIVDKYPSYMTDNASIKTICHGDLYHNNIMVKEINGKPVEVVAVDYQITHRGNPVLDFIYFIFWGTDQEFRKNHLEHLKNLYYQHLGVFLKYFDIAVEDIFSTKEFEKQYQEKLDFGLMIAVFYLPFLFPLEEDTLDLTNTKPLDEIDINLDKKYGERLNGIVDDFIQWGYL